MDIVVTGATGTVGRQLVNELVAAGVTVRAVTRRPDTANFPLGVSVVASVIDALPGASAVFLNSRALGKDLSDVASQARRHGVRRLIALAALNVDDDDTRQPSRFIGDRNREVEQAAVDSGLEWVSLRPTQFFSALADMWVQQIQSCDTVSGPCAAACSAPINAPDIAAVAARAFLTDDLVGRKIALTGPQALTNTELADVVGEVLGRPLHYREVPVDQVHRRFIDRGFPVEFAEAYLAMQADTLRTPPLVTDEVHTILGRPALSWREWVSEHRALFTAQPGRQTA
jgi:uncharacterized protein YbjT (DUF2867 family)